MAETITELVNRCYWQLREETGADHVGIRALIAAALGEYEVRQIMGGFGLPDWHPENLDDEDDEL